MRDRMYVFRSIFGIITDKRDKLAYKPFASFRNVQSISPILKKMDVPILTNELPRISVNKVLQCISEIKVPKLMRFKIN